MTVTDSLMTTDELLAIPEDGTERELIRGQLKEREMTRRRIRHTWSGANMTFLLRAWVKGQPSPH